LHRFRVQQDQSPFVNRKDSEIAEFIVTKIAKQVRQSMSNLNVALDADEIAANKLKELTIPYLAINNQYPINFLLQRSRDIGYELFIEEIPSPTAANTPRNVVVHYRPVAADKATVYQLVWGESLVSFQPTLQMANQVSSLTVRGWDPQGKTKIEKTVNRSEVKGIIQPGDLDLDQTGLSQKAEYVCDHPIQSVAEAKVIGMNRLLRMSQDTVEGRGKTVGLPNLRAGTKVVILGLGKRFSGVYLISTTTHTMGDSGYTTDFTAKMVAKTIGGN
jgi:phage protein D